MPDLLALAGQSYSAYSLAAAAQESVNFFAEPLEDPNEKQKGKFLLIGCPGKHLFKDLTAINAALTPVRGVWFGGGRLFVAAGARYCEVDSSGNLVGSVRTIVDDAGHSPVTFIANGTQLAIHSVSTLYVDNGAGPTAITLPALTGSAIALGVNVDRAVGVGDAFDPGMAGQTIVVNGTSRTVATVFSPDYLTVTATFGGVPVQGVWTSSPTMSVSSIASLDGYLIASRTNSRVFNLSPLLDWSNGGTYVWDPLSFAQKESYPDYIRSVLVAGEQLYIWGTESFEVWQNVGGADFPFQRIDGATGKFGTSSPWGPIAIDGRVYFHATNTEGQISSFVLDGWTPKRISTFAQESDWLSTGFGSTAISYSYFEQGHHFWGMDFGSAGSVAYTWFYDLATAAWHQRSRYVSGAFAAFGIAYHTFVTNSPTASGNNWTISGKHIVGGGLDGKLYWQSLAFYDDNGTDMKQRRALPYQYNGGNRMYFGRLDLEMQTGTVASGAEPVASLDWSDDRGQTFNTPVTAGLGVHDDFSKRVFWPNNGSSRGRVFRVAFVGQSKIVLVTANLDRVDGIN